MNCKIANISCHIPSIERPVQIMLPLSCTSFDAFQRSLAKHVEEVIWAFPYRAQNIIDVSLINDRSTSRTFSFRFQLRA